MNTGPMNRTAPAARRLGASISRMTRITRRQRGFTMIEGLICVTVLLLAVSATLPGFSTAREHRRVEGAAAQLETDLQLARSLAVAQNRTVRFEIGRDEHGTCYVVHNGAAGDCTCSAQGAVCKPGLEAHRSQHYAADTGVTLQANVGSMVFDPLKGTVTPAATLRVEGARTSLRQIINIMGRIRTCSPDGAMAGYKTC
ncbi:MAG: GspH/FimT family pseudopilin [Burkholderiales bacterium]|nr:GspH/FimT family pseudopilin [Burkholderiales bacterium]